MNIIKQLQQSLPISVDLLVFNVSEMALNARMIFNIGRMAVELTWLEFLLSRERRFAEGIVRYVDPNCPGENVGLKYSLLEMC